MLLVIPASTVRVVVMKDEKRKRKNRKTQPISLYVSNGELRASVNESVS